MSTGHIVKFGELLEERRSQIENIIRGDLRFDQIKSIALRLMDKSDKLALCDHKSIYLSIISACEMGLSFGMVGSSEAWLVPFKVKGKYTAQLIPGYTGLVKLAHNTGQVTEVDAICVYANEPFHRSEGASPSIEHTPIAEHDKRGDFVGVYARAWWVASRRFQFHYLSADDVNKVKAVSRNTGEYSIWEKWPDPMRRKTAMRSFTKILPRGPEIALALAQDAQYYEEEPAPRRVAATVTGPDELAEQLGGNGGNPDENEK